MFQYKKQKTRNDRYQYLYAVSYVSAFVLAYCTVVRPVHYHVHGNTLPALKFRPTFGIVPNPADIQAAYCVASSRILNEAKFARTHTRAPALQKRVISDVLVLIKCY